MRTHSSFCLVAALFSATALAQPYEWVGAGPGVWSEGAKWSLGTPPIFNKAAYINDGSTVTLDVITPNLNSTYLGLLAGESGELLVSGAGNELHAGLFYIGFNGEGAATLEPGGLIDLNTCSIATNDVASVGTLDINGGELSATGLYIANRGTGTVTFNDGVIGVTGIDMAYYPGSVASFTQLGGTLTSTSFYGAFDGAAVFSIQGGTTSLFGGTVGLTSIGPPTQMLIGGTADVYLGNFYIGGTGPGVITQSAGEVEVSSLYLSSPAVLGGEGTYNLEGGVLDINSVYGGLGTVNDFNMTGGVFICNNFGSSASPVDLDPTGGLIRPRGDAQLDVDVIGNLNLGPAASVEIELNTEFLTDRFDVFGTVTLAGTMLPVLITAPDPGDTFTVVNNDGVDPVVGEFAGMPEGTVITLYDGPDDYDYAISYVGGDGNDVVLQVACPADITGDGILDGGDLTAFVAFYLAGDLTADLNNDGVLDGGDINTLVTSYIAGC